MPGVIIRCYYKMIPGCFNFGSEKYSRDIRLKIETFLVDLTLANHLTTSRLPVQKENTSSKIDLKVAKRGSLVFFHNSEFHAR